jgi:recombination protein RecT
MAITNVRQDQLPRGAGTAAHVVPVPAASILLLRDAPLRVLMIRRHDGSSFVPSAWVFPGGGLDDEDRSIAGGDEPMAMRVCAARELFEETGIWLGSPLADSERMRERLLGGSLTFRDLLAASSIAFDSLVWTARWITPVGNPRRFDAWFFLAPAPPDAIATVDRREAVELTWISPQEALDRHATGDFPMVFPTIKNLESIASFHSADELIASRRGARIATMRPILVVRDGQQTIVLPDELP